MIKIIDLRIRELTSMTRAFCDIDYNGLIVKGLKVVEGSKGFFVSMPREKGKDDKWYDIVYPSNMELKQEIEDLILGKYYELKAKELPPEAE